MTVSPAVLASLGAALEPKYKLERLLGEGGMGAVYLATEVALGRVVAVKLLSSSLARDDRFRRRFDHEARAVAAISHPNVVKIYTVGEIEGSPPRPYIIMQYVEGTSLEDLLPTLVPCPERRARRLLRDVAAALAAAHERDLIHRDIKPANILIERATGQAYVVDFGISVALSSRALGGAEPIVEEGLIIGTVPYMSPEQSLGAPVGPKSDVYSLGVVAYELLSGSMPFAGSSAAEWRAAHILKQPTPLRERCKGVSEELGDLVGWCLVKDPDLRPLAADLGTRFLPSVEHEILWPPPGLALLPVLGNSLRRAAAILIGAVVTSLGLLAMPVAGVHTAADWWEAWAGESIVATSTAAGPNSVLVVLWQAALVSGVIALCIGLTIFVNLAVRSARTALELRSRGWRMETIQDAFADPDGRTGLVLSGSGHFARLQPSTRFSIRRSRRLAHSTLVAGAAWLAVLLTGWAASLLIGSPLQTRAGPPVALPQLLIAVLPLLACLSLMLAALLRERREIGTPWRRAHAGTFAVPSDATRTEIESWYAELPGDPGPATPRRAPPLLVRRSTPLLAALISGLTIAGVCLLMGATLWAGRLARRLGPDTVRAAAFIQGSDGRSGLADARRALREYRPAERVNNDAVETLASLLGTASSAIPPYPAEPRVVLGSRQGRLASTTLVSESLRHATEMSAGKRAILAALADHPRTTAFRALARSPAFRLPPDGDASSSIRTAMEANAAGAVLAAAAGDLAGAANRLGENAVIADLAVGSPGSYWPETGMRMLQSLVLLPLAEVERSRGNERRRAELQNAAAGVAESVDRFGASLRVGGIGLASDPRDFRLLHRLLDDNSVPSGLRSAALEESGNGVCLNPREWLSGADARRTARQGGDQLLPAEFQAQGIANIVARFRYCISL